VDNGGQIMLILYVSKALCLRACPCGHVCVAIRPTCLVAHVPGRMSAWAAGIGTEGVCPGLWQTSRR